MSQKNSTQVFGSAQRKRFCVRRGGKEKKKELRTPTNAREKEKRRTLNARKGKDPSSSKGPTRGGGVPWAGRAGKKKTIISEKREKKKKEGESPRRRGETPVRRGRIHPEPKKKKSKKRAGKKFPPGNRLRRFIDGGEKEGGRKKKGKKRRGRSHVNRYAKKGKRPHPPKGLGEERRRRARKKRGRVTLDIAKGISTQQKGKNIYIKRKKGGKKE